jgi:hypothetical protein
MAENREDVTEQLLLFFLRGFHLLSGEKMPLGDDDDDDNARCKDIRTILQKCTCATVSTFCVTYIRAIREESFPLKATHMQFGVTIVI